MKKAFFSIISLVVVFAMALSFASCDGDDDATAENTSNTTQPTQTNSTQSTEKQTEKATDASTVTPDVTSPVEDPVTNVVTTDVPTTNTPETTVPEITVQTTKAPQTSAPAEDTKAPLVTTAPKEETTTAATTTVPSEETTTAPTTTSPIEETKSPETTAPWQDPNVDYSEWGYYGFEALLPAPLPFNDTQWLSRRYAGNSYGVMSDKPFKISAKKENIKTLKNYVKSLEAFGYTYLEEDYSYIIYDGKGSNFEFMYRDHYVCVTFTLV